MLNKIKETAKFINSETKDYKAEVAIVLGTGLGGLVNDIDIDYKISYKDIPNFPTSTVEGHEGNLIFGKLQNKKVVAMQGRFHYYEGYSMKEITFPIRVFKALGIELLFVSNASGGLNPDFKVGDLMIITDHINLFGTNPLIGRNIDELGPRFPDMSEAYNKELMKRAEEVAKQNNIEYVKGVYAGLSGPTFETPAEYFYIRNIGADAVGMSTVPEVIVARHMDMKCLAFSVITDSGVPGEIVEISHEEVQAAAAGAEPKLTTIIKGVLTTI